MKKHDSNPDVELPSQVVYRETLFQGHERPFKQSLKLRTWRVDYDLAYDGGGASFSQYYRTRFGAKFSAFFHVYIRSWGGLAELVHQPTERQFKPPEPPKKGKSRG